MVGISWRLRSEKARFARSLMASGLLSVAPLLAIAPSTSFRYAVWLVATGLIGTALIVSGQLDSRAKRPRRQTVPDTDALDRH